LVQERDFVSSAVAKKFTLELQAGAFGPNLDHPAIVRVGKIEKNLVVKDHKPTG